VSFFVVILSMVLMKMVSMVLVKMVSMVSVKMVSMAMHQNIDSDSDFVRMKEEDEYGMQSSAQEKARRRASRLCVQVCAISLKSLRNRFEIGARVFDV
jgi:hypothetical protein